MLTVVHIKVMVSLDGASMFQRHFCEDRKLVVHALILYMTLYVDTTDTFDAGDQKETRRNEKFKNKKVKK